jgi:hypothetical protein
MTTSETVIIKKADAWSIQLLRVDGGVEVTVKTEPLLVTSFKLAMQNGAGGASRRRSMEVNRVTTDGSDYVVIPRQAEELVGEDSDLTPFVFTQNPIGVVVPVMRTNEQLASFALKAKSFISRWYESRLKPVSVVATVTITTAERIE